MRIADIPFNMKIEIDASFKERPEDLDEMSKGIDYIFDKLSGETKPAVKASLHSLAGKYLRIINRLEESEEQIIHAFEAFRELELHVPAVIAKFRLGLTFLYQEKYTRSDDFLKKVLEICLKSKDEHLVRLLDHVYFTMGLSKLWQGQKEDAGALFNECLELRIVKGDMALIELCQKAISSTS
jgi:tetratricopeptide (TPR) repeat protein